MILNFHGKTNNVSLLFLILILVPIVALLSIQPQSLSNGTLKIPYKIKVFQHCNKIFLTVTRGLYTFPISPQQSFKVRSLSSSINITKNEDVFSMNSVTVQFNVQFIGNKPPVSPAITFVFPNATITSFSLPLNISVPLGTKYVIEPIIQSAGYRWVTNAKNGVVNLTTSSIKITYYEQVLINVSSMFPVYAWINGKIEALKSGWYNYSTSIQVEKITYYQSSDEKYTIINPPQFTVTSPLKLVVNFEKQYLVNVSSPYPVVINGVITNSMWINAGSDMTINAQLPFYLQGEFTGTENISLGGSVTVNQPLSEKLITTVNVLLAVGIPVIISFVIGIFALVVKIREYKEKNKFNAFLQQVQKSKGVSEEESQTQSSAPINWDPNTWVNKNLFGYRVTEVIGKGDNGYVLKAELGGKDYALKVLNIYYSPTSNSSTLRSLSSFEQLYYESPNIVKLSRHPNTVEIHSTHIDLEVIREIMKGHIEIYSSYPPLIVMDYVKGISVDKLLKAEHLTNSPYWPLIVKEIIRQVASALDYIHKNGFVHSDVKPQNILLSNIPEGSPDVFYESIKDNVKLGDLSSAVRIKGKIEQMNPGYAPPEQLEAIINGKGADPKMDIYALGMIAYTLLKGKNDYPGKEYLSKAVDEYLNGNISNALNYLKLAKQELQSWKIDLPQNTLLELEEVIERSLSLDPKKRPTAEEIVKMLS